MSEKDILNVERQSKKLCTTCKKPIRDNCEDCMKKLVPGQDCSDLRQSLNHESKHLEHASKKHHHKRRRLSQNGSGHMQLMRSHEAKTPRMNVDHPHKPQWERQSSAEEEMKKADIVATEDAVKKQSSFSPERLFLTSVILADINQKLLSKN